MSSETRTLLVTSCSEPLALEGGASGVLPAFTWEMFEKTRRYPNLRQSCVVTRYFLFNPFFPEKVLVRSAQHQSLSACDFAWNVNSGMSLARLFRKEVVVFFPLVEIAFLQ